MSDSYDAIRSAGAGVLAGKAGVALGAKDASEIDPDHLGATIARAMMPSGQPTWEPRPMPDYRVCFINEIPRNDKLFRCCQRSIIIQSAPTAEWAVEEAKKQFARLEGIKN